ncbi:FHA domain-containing protein [Chloroflexota bacterium]
MASQRFPVNPQGLTIGRNPDNDIVLAGEFTVSRHHAVIVMEQGQYVLYDRDSVNGTWVNEQRAFRHTLVSGDRIRIWQSQFVFSVPGASLPSTPVPAGPDTVVHATGEQFDGYLLESLIGQGGMSEVYKARDPSGQTVAIKILQETNPYLVAKFVQEGNEIGPLLRGHSNIVFVHKFGQGPDGRLYLVMEFVDAPSLRKVMQHRLGKADVTRIMGQTCSALAFAHQNDIVHRDIKPENILVTSAGVVKVLDFGIAKLTSASTVTRDKIVGTPEYLSPEQARGDPVQPASDVYSLGVVLYEMLAGSVPFPRPRNEDPYKAAMVVIRQHLKERPMPIRKRNPEAEVPRQLEKVSMRALEKNVKDRYTTAREMGQAIGHSPAVTAAPPAVKPAEASLIVLGGPRQGQRITLTNRSRALGRFDLDSSDTGISRHHATIVFRAGGYWLQDISKNGTWVDNERVYGEKPLRSGSVITIGENALRLEMSQN